MSNGICATTGCHNPARWISVREAKDYPDAKHRCTVCCDAIAHHDIPAGGLYDVAQLRPWSKIPRDYRGTGADGVRRVLAMTNAGTSLVPWYGPIRGGAR